MIVAEEDSTAEVCLEVFIERYSDALPVDGEVRIGQDSELYRRRRHNGCGHATREDSSPTVFRRPFRVV